MIFEEEINFPERIIVIIFLLFLLLALLYAMAILVEKYMLSCFQIIALKYKFNDQMTGFFLAIASSIPEFTTNSIASLNQNTSMLQFGMGAITGSGAYDFTICLAVGSLFIVKSQYPEGLLINKLMFYRDSIIYLLTLAILAFFLRDNIIDIFEALILCCLWPCYLYMSSKFSVVLDEVKDIEEEESNNLIDQGKLMRNPEVKKDSKNIIYSAVVEVNDIINKNNSTKNNSTNFYDDKLNDEEILEKKEQDIENPPIHIVESFKPDNDQFKFIKFFLNPPKFAFEKINMIIITIYDLLIPVEKSITISLMVLTIFTFLQTRATIFLIEKLSHYSNLSTSFLGMTLVSWGNNVGDTINACVAAKLGKVDLLIASILGTQILNLQFCLGFPWLISTLTTSGLQILITDTNTFKFFATVFFVVLATILVLTMFSMRLNRISGFILVIIYLIYITYEFKNNISII